MDEIALSPTREENPTGLCVQRHNSSGRAVSNSPDRGYPGRMSASVTELRLPGPGARSLPVIEVGSGKPGPLAVVTANLHGDEATGVGAVHVLASRLDGLLARGRVRLFPSLNPVGLAQGTRGLPGDELDPNRCFPGDA